MLRINKKTDYAVRVLLAIAKQGPGARVRTSVIQKQMLIPRPFLQRIVADLSRAGLIHTFPGPKGGLQLACSTDDVNLLHIIEAMDGPLLISDCLAEDGFCELDITCPVHPRWERIQALIVAELEQASLAQLAKEAFAKEHISLEEIG
jgi:Rrf2 family protein